MYTLSVDFPLIFYGDEKWMLGETKTERLDSVLNREQKKLILQHREINLGVIVNLLSMKDKDSDSN